MTLLLKLTLAPTFVAGISLAGRRWGPLVAGWLAGLPVVAGPILYIYALEQGPGFAAGAALSTLTGLLSLGAFCLVYAWLSEKFSWPWCLLAGWASFLGATVAFRPLSWPLWLALPGVFAGIGLILRFLPAADAPVAKNTPTRWDLPLRMGSAAVLVLALTGAAAWLGPTWSGLLTPFPVATSVLAVFSHVGLGRGGAIALLRALLGGLFGFSVFCALVAALLPSWGLAGAFALGLLGCSLVNGAGYLFSRRALERSASNG
ncbi:MAG: hypothetical protein AB1405_02850 [Bdellovibrionota bacterium]